jgi:hypothetical protein
LIVPDALVTVPPAVPFSPTVNVTRGPFDVVRRGGGIFAAIVVGRGTSLGTA